MVFTQALAQFWCGGKKCFNELRLMVLDSPDHEIKRTSGFGQEVTFFYSACGALFHQDFPSFPTHLGWTGTALYGSTVQENANPLVYEKIRT